MSDNLLQTLSEGRVPATIRDTEVEPVEPREPSSDFQRGRSPDDVVQPREERDEFDLTTREPAPEPTVRVGDRDVTGKEVTEQVLALAQDNQQLREQNQAMQAQQQQAAPEITNAAIAKTYDPVSVTILNDLLAAGLLEEDFTAAYPRTAQTFTGQARFAFDLIARNQQALERAIERLEATVTWLNHHKGKIEGQGDYGAMLDALKEPKLNDAKTREQFTRFVMGRATESAKAALAELWSEFASTSNASTSKKSTSQIADDRWRAQQGRGRVTGDIPGIVGAGGDLLLRLAASSGKMVR
jgi:hypothetical protein